uniref:Uncharacterized protein n=1 Tax=Cacopsylla melanoneura TaxID=428564 RepID=A0A8D8M988_9HEMI
MEMLMEVRIRIIQECVNFGHVACGTLEIGSLVRVDHARFTATSDITVNGGEARFCRQRIGKLKMHGFDSHAYEHSNVCFGDRRISAWTRLEQVRTSKIKSCVDETTTLLKSRYGKVTHILGASGGGQFVAFQTCENAALDKIPGGDNPVLAEEEVLDKTNTTMQRVQVEVVYNQYCEVGF